MIAPVRELGVMIGLGEGHTAGEYSGKKCFHNYLGRTNSVSVTDLANLRIAPGCAILITS